MAENSLHDFRQILNRLFCRCSPFEQRKLHIFHAVCCCAGGFCRAVVLGLSPQFAGSLKRNDVSCLQSMRKRDMWLARLPVSACAYGELLTII